MYYYNDYFVSDLFRYFVHDRQSASHINMISANKANFQIAMPHVNKGV